jgi:hypothetical protein
LWMNYLLLLLLREAFDRLPSMVLVFAPWINTLLYISVGLVEGKRDKIRLITDIEQEEHT